MADTIRRQWSILRALHRHPRRRTARDIQEALHAEGFTETKRTIERDLENLSTHWPITADRRGKPYGWSWMKDAQVVDIPGMEPATALAFQLAHRYLAPLLPPPTLQHLKPYFDRAAAVLNASAAPRLRAWPKKVRVIGHGPELLPPQTAPGVHETILQALLDNKRVEARYTPRDSDAGRDYVVSPLGAVFRQSIVYIVGTLWDYDDIKQFALHRFSRATVTDEDVKPPRHFDLNAYIDEGAFGYPAGSGRIRLKVLFSAEAAKHLYETPLSRDQALSPDKDGRVALTATVLDTADLRWWLLGFGASVEVQSPAKLRRELGRIARDMSALYDAEGARHG